VIYIIAKKVLFWITVAVIPLTVYGGATALQLIPLVIMLCLLIAEIWGKKKMIIPAMVVSILMFVINITIPSLIDLMYWAGIFIVYYLVR
jgi:hypothetical protein